MARPTSLRIGGRLRGLRPCQAVAHTWAGLSEAVERVERGEEAHPSVSGLAKARRAPPPSGTGSNLGGSVRGGGRERGGAVRAFSRPRSSGLVEAHGPRPLGRS